MNNLGEVYANHKKKILVGGVAIGLGLAGLAWHYAKSESKDKGRHGASSLSSPKSSSSDDEPYEPIVDKEVRQAIEYARIASNQFNNSEFENAAKNFTKAINLHKDFKWFTNRAMVYIKLNRFDSAYSDANESIKILPTAKGYYAKGKIDMALKKYEAALKNFETARSLPDADKIDKTIKNNVQEAKRQLDLQVKATREKSEREKAIAELTATSQNRAPSKDILPLPSIASEAKNAITITSNTETSFIVSESAASPSKVEIVPTITSSTLSTSNALLSIETTKTANTVSEPSQSPGNGVQSPLSPSVDLSSSEVNVSMAGSYSGILVEGPPITPMAVSISGSTILVNHPHDSPDSPAADPDEVENPLLNPNVDVEQTRKSVMDSVNSLLEQDDEEEQQEETEEGDKEGDQEGDEGDEGDENEQQTKH